ncbi:MAG TPA: 16S rRNA (adenine(1518)-N(6)/adenine(1519)-N(6))-dimethyltransferase [Rhodospirillaceae bacterium]|nr:16S rRNA (adenine(1518)-N(6)/adenine(1519)-N(6))-dimethyltransferase [Rhodospirillaceae bacterium]
MEGLPPLRETIAAHGLAAHKALGQHFLLDLNLTQRIVKEAGDLAGVHVIEIGPGPGGLTRALLGSVAAQVTAIEKDRRCVAALQNLVERFPKRFTLIEGDALKEDVLALAKAPRAIIANLPYNVGTPLLLSWLSAMDQFQSLTLMLQAEVVDRLVAAPNSKAYGRLSVITQFCADARRVMKVPARAFTPPPKVDSAVVHLTPRKNRPQDVDLKTLEAVTAAAFGQRRKMLRSSLKSMGGEALLARAGISPEKRAEELSLADFESLVRALRQD